jgi:hypothetical protein
MSEPQRRIEVMPWGEIWVYPVERALWLAAQNKIPVDLKRWTLSDLRTTDPVTDAAVLIMLRMMQNMPEEAPS